MKNALVSGATSGIGLAISRKLLKLGYVVYGIGRDFSQTKTLGENFHPLQLNLSNIQHSSKELENIDVDFDVLVNSAGIGIFEPHEELNPKKIEELISINLTSSITLTNIFLRGIKKQKGYIFNITSVEATRSSKFSALYSATKSGLRAFSHALFEEVRKDGVKVVSINPDMTKTPFFDELRFECAENCECSIDADEIADFVEFALKSSFVPTDVTLRPQKFGILKKR